ncbi:fimbrial assembly protein PilN [Peptostreptococcaceae bacterium AS15]|nr:fimbrial assembly protein PilN [Peptostreptococcaceae bacterium AS15]
MELNFFNPFLVSKREKKTGGSGGGGGLSFISILITAIVIIALVAYAVYSITSIQLAEKTIVDLQQQLNDPTFAKQLKEAQKKEEEIASIQAERAFLEKVDIGIKDIDTVTTNLLSLIAKNITSDLYLTDIDVKLNEITLTGKSKSKLSIAQFEYNIRTSELFDNIYVDSIKLEEETKAYDFVIKFTAKKEAYQGSAKPANAAKTGNAKQPANNGTKGGK